MGTKKVLINFILHLKKNFRPKMKNLYHRFLIVIFLLIVGGLYSCINQSKPDAANTNKFNAKLNQFKKSIHKVDITITLVDSLEKQQEKINAERNDGKISESEAKKRMDIIDKTLGRKVAQTTNLHPASNLPTWAKALGLSMPQGMKLDTDYSQTTSKNNPDEGFNSVLLIFKGNYKTAMQQAAIIAKGAHVPLAKEYKTAFEMKQKYGDEIVKGAVYMNFELGAPRQPKYSIAITVNESGTLTISAADSKSMEKHLQLNQIKP